MQYIYKHGKFIIDKPNERSEFVIIFIQISYTFLKT